MVKKKAVGKRKGASYKSREKIKNYLEGKEVRKFIYIQDRLTNIVV